MMFLDERWPITSHSRAERKRRPACNGRKEKGSGVEKRGRGSGVFFTTPSRFLRGVQSECQALCLTPFLPHPLSMALFPPPFFPGRSLFHESFSRFLRGVEMTGVRLLVFQPSSTRLSRLSVSKNPAVERAGTIVEPGKLCPVGDGCVSPAFVNHHPESHQRSMTWKGSRAFEIGAILPGSALGRSRLFVIWINSVTGVPRRSSHEKRISWSINCAARWEGPGAGPRSDPVRAKQGLGHDGSRYCLAGRLG